MDEISTIGRTWISEEIQNLTDRITHISPSDYNEAVRYLPESVSSLPGFIRYDVNPFMREIVDCFDINSPVREVTVKKGVQVTYTTCLESGALYFMSHVKTLPIMYLTADRQLAEARIENNFIPMLEQSGLSHIIRSADVNNARKTGKTKEFLQFEGGGYLVPFGAKNADKMRSFSICIMLKDEIDAWPQIIGKDGDPDALSDARCSGYWQRRKIIRGSTPLIKSTSKIEKAYLRGDQRKYKVCCKSCGFPQELRWKSHNKDNEITGGFKWDMEGETLIVESVCYCCKKCGEPHYEHDKERLFSPEYGARWEPTAQPVEPGIRSYHLPAFYSPLGMQPWSQCVLAWLRGFDPIEKRVRDIGAFQVFYNNILAEPFEVRESKLKFHTVSGHRRSVYRLGEIPNKYAIKYSGSPILFLSCQVDVHKTFLSVAIIGWCRGAISYLIDYYRIEIEADDAEANEISSSVWRRLQAVIEEGEYTADDGKTYQIVITLIDAGYANATVTRFCSDYVTGVYPLLGRDRTARYQSMREFAEYHTQSGTLGFRVLVDHYKDRLAPILRREWYEVDGAQREYHFNAPVDLTDKALQELTVETRKEKTDERGKIFYYWHRPGNARNELWDLLVYGHAAMEIVAYNLCIQEFGMENIDWPQFWDYMADSLN